LTDLQVSDLFNLELYGFTEGERDQILIPILRTQLKASLHNHHIKSLFEKTGFNPDSNFFPEDVPAVPVTMFKEFNLETVPKDLILKTLRSSGTTGQIPSVIPLDKETMLNQTKALAGILSSFMGKQRRQFIVIDYEGINSPVHAFTARTAGVRGLSLYAKKTTFLLKESDGVLTLNPEALEEISGFDPGQPIYAFGFTWIIWSVFVQEMLKRDLKFLFKNFVLFHSGGWKKLSEQAVSKEEFSRQVAELFGTYPSSIIDFYGMAEETGIIFPDCLYGNKHTPIFSKIILRNLQTLQPCKPGETGLVEVMSVLPHSYYGQAVLTEDIGQVIGVDDCPCGRRGIYFRFVKRIQKADLRGCGDTFRVKL
jgi:hypothetical protein